MNRRTPLALLALAATGLSLSACAGVTPTPSGFLSSYEGLAERKDTVRASVQQRRDESRAQDVDRLWIAPAEFLGAAHPAVDEVERGAVLREVDRQVCYELSERFTVLEEPSEGVASVRVGVTRIHPTNPAGSAVAAVANAFIPGPVTVRTPGGTGGLGAEAELLDAEGRQVAAIVWSRDAMVVGADSPSLSQIGDAHQLAEPLGDMIGDAFAPTERKVRPIPDPDPCGRFGPRNRPGAFLLRAVTGLYQPELSGGGETPADAEGGSGRPRR